MKTEVIEKMRLSMPYLIILLHNIHGYYINIEILFKCLQGNNIPVVWIFYDCWLIAGLCSYFAFVSCEKWKNQCFSCPQKTSYPASWLIDRSGKNFNIKKKLVIYFVQNIDLKLLS